MTSNKMNKNDALQKFSKSIEKENEGDSSNIKRVEVKFGKTTVYGEYVQNVRLKNLGNTETFCYKLLRDPDINPLYRVFNFNKYEGVVKPGEHLQLKVHYNPNIPFRTDIENFDLVDSSSNIMKIRVVGDSIAPTLKTSVKDLILLKTSEKTCRRAFELNNASSVPAEFIFDCNNENGTFHVKPTKGTLKPNQHTFIQITFVPKKFGTYSEQLHCLTWGGVPLSIELRGVYRKPDTQDGDSTMKSSFQEYSMPIQSRYSAYMQDCLNTESTRPPVSMSRNYIDFGRTLKSDDPNSTTEFITLTNNLQNDITVKWPQDDIFKIIPTKINISPNKNASFRCCFFPNCNNKLFCTILTAQIKWIPKTTGGLIFPIAVAIKLQGHSFPEDQFWTPITEVSPRTITLPPGTLEYPSFTNFKISSFGHLPVMYKLIPPKDTNFVMKPMVGIIDPYAIVVVQFHWKDYEEHKLCKEMWHIELNGRKEKQIPICIRAEIELPKILIGDQNTITFEPNQPGCESIVYIPLKNVSGHLLRFQFRNVDYERIKIQPLEGILPANEEVYIKFSYTGNLNDPKKMQLKIDLQRIQGMEELIGRTYSHSFFIHTNCQYYQLCCTPSYHDFEEVELDSLLETKFYIFNFGLCNVNFTLKFESDHFDNLKVQPLKGDIKPKEKRKIRIKGLAKKVGEYVTSISYTTRTYDDTVEAAQNINLFEIKYTAVLPTIQIGDIVHYDFGPLFSKEHFWNFLKIEQLNNYLENMSKGERRSILLHLPEVPVSDEKYYITLLAENKSEYEMEVLLKRKKVCDCSMENVAVNINTSKKQYDCPHRDMLIMELPEPKFYKNTHQLLTIKVKYCLKGETNMCYILQLSHDRSIEISFILYSIPIDTIKMSCYGSEFNMHLRTVSVCRKVPPIQICWFYNNTNQFGTYELDTTNLESLCFSEDFEIIKCINPKGRIEPYSTLPLMIRFQPIEIKEYTVEAPLMCGDQIYNFCIRGSGKRDINNYSYRGQMPTTAKRCQYAPIVLSHEYLYIDFIPHWTVTERVIFIQNRSKDKIFQYFWEEVSINNIVEVKATNKTGILQPREFQAVVIKIKTFNESCITTLSLPCQFIDYTQLIMHQKSLEASRRQLQKEKRLGISQQDLREEETSIPLPKPFTKTVVISFQIIHSKDRDYFFTVEEQFRSNPQDEININISNLLNSDSENQNINDDEKLSIQDQDKRQIVTILEQLIADFVFSKSLPEILEYSKNLPPPVYEQFTLDERQIIEKKKTNAPLSNYDLMEFRKREIKKLFTRPQPTLVSEVAKDLIIHGIHDTFKLGAFTPFEVDDTEEFKDVDLSCQIDCKCKIKKQ